jgi:hypothetical protein
MVATEGHEVGLAGLLKSFQSPRHGASLRRENSPTQAKRGLEWATREGWGTLGWIVLAGSKNRHDLTAAA